MTDALVSVLPQISHGDFDRMREVAAAIFANTDPEMAGGQNLRDRCIQLLTSLYVWRGDEGSGEFLQAEIIARAKDRPSEIRQLVLRNAQTHGGPEEEHTAIRRRAIGLIDDALRASIAAYREIWESLEGRSDLTEDDPEVKLGREAAQNIDTIAREIYFASGAFDEKQGKGHIDPEKRERLYRETADVLDDIADVPLPSVTHHLLETLEVFVDFDPGGVFLRIGAAIRGGKAGGYQFDSMAVGLFVRLIERYLADYRTLLQQDDEVRALLIEMLDVFVEAGWPKARQLTYGLHELFR